MTNFITKAAIAAIVAFGTIGGVAADANAAQVEIIIKKPHVVRRPVIVVRPRVVVVRPRVVVRRPVVIVRPAPVVVYKAGRCSQSLALTKAYNAGLNRVSVASIGPNRVTVSGKAPGRGNWVRLSFANVAGCPRL